MQNNVGGSQSGTISSGGNNSTTTPSSGGVVANVGGTNANGGSAKGGSAAGGVAQGGNRSGGASSGGTVSVGGAPAAGGTNNFGGAATGGQSGATGGSAAGGKASGGQTVGGAAAGGKAAGGSAVGGQATGGNATGGGATGGAGVGGTAGTGGSTWKQCYSNDKMPTNPVLKVDPDATGYTTSISNSSYVVMLIGPNRPACITDDVAKRDLAFLDEGLREVVELVGFPAFPEWKKGYYLNWVILNSGIPNATLPDEGGHQGNKWGHMNFESTYTCPCTWDDYQSGGALHECVHALQAELYKYNNRASGWAHEAHNNYLTTQANALAHSKYTMGWSASLILNMPHVPIESMGLNTDDSVAGPADQNAKTYVSTQVRYGGEIFFLSLNQTMGRGFVNCLWIDAPANNQKSIFQILQTFSGEAGVANAIMTFAAKSAILDFEGWTETMRTLMKGNWNNTTWWFYMYPGGDGTTAFRPPTKQIPHHQGRNIIPIKVNTGATAVTVEFTPDAAGSKGTKENMQAQLVYRDSADKPVYGTVFSSGQGTIQLPSAPRNGIVNLVVAVTNANAASGGDDDSNKGFDAQEHFSYQARIVSGGVIAPNTTRPW